jgi:hypothetical protein
VRWQSEWQCGHRQPGVEALVRIPIRHVLNRVAIFTQTRMDAGPIMAQWGNATRARNDDALSRIAAAQARPPLTEIT